jgi:hypothetical protein
MALSFLLFVFSAIDGTEMAKPICICTLTRERAAIDTMPVDAH